MQIKVNIYSQKDTIFFGVLNKESELVFKKNFDFHDFDNVSAICTEFLSELKKVILKPSISSVGFIKNNTDVGEKELISILESNLGCPIQMITLETALTKSVSSLENKLTGKSYIIHLDDYISIYSVENSIVSHHLEANIDHHIIDDLGRECFCGKMGCLIQYASPTGLIKTAQEKVEFYSGPTQLALETPGQLKFKKLVSFTKKGDPLAIEILNQTTKISVPILTNLMSENPVEKVIITGQLGKFGKLISKPLQHQLSEVYGKTTPVLTPFSKSYEELFVSFSY